MEYSERLVINASVSLLSPTFDQQGLILHQKGNGLDSSPPPRTAMILDTEAQASIIDSAQTIILCAQHQKRIVDDIVSLSILSH